MKPGPAKRKLTALPGERRKIWREGSLPFTASRMLIGDQVISSFEVVFVDSGSFRTRIPSSTKLSVALRECVQVEVWSGDVLVVNGSWIIASIREKEDGTELAFER